MEIKDSRVLTLIRDRTVASAGKDVALTAANITTSQTVTVSAVVFVSPGGSSAAWHVQSWHGEY